MIACGDSRTEKNIFDSNLSLDVPDPQISLDLLSIREVWNSGLHSAFTDVALLNNRFYIAFREAPAHNPSEGNGSIRVISFVENGPVIQNAHLKLNSDLRDPKLLIIGDNKIFVTFAGISSSPTAKVTNYIANLDTGEITVLDNSLESWLWRLSSIDSKLIGFSYYVNSLPTDPVKGLIVTADENFLILQKFESAVSGECTIRQSTSYKVYAVCRQRDNSMKIGYMENLDLHQFRWSNIDPAIGGPNFLILNDEVGLISGRFYGHRGLRTAIGSLSLKNGKIKELLRLPSGGDTGYPGLILRKDILYVSYYYQPTGVATTNIYFAKIKVDILK